MTTNNNYSASGVYTPPLSRKATEEDITGVQDITSQAYAQEQDTCDSLQQTVLLDEERKAQQPADTTTHYHANKQQRVSSPTQVPNHFNFPSEPQTAAMYQHCLQTKPRKGHSYAVVNIKGNARVIAGNTYDNPLALPLMADHEYKELNATKDGQVILGDQPANFALAFMNGARNATQAADKREESDEEDFS